MRALAFIVSMLVSVLAGPAVFAGNRPTVMVLYFDNNTGGPGYDGLAKGLADMMTTDLASVPSVQVVEREKLDALLAELKLQRSKYFDAKTAQRLGRGMGAQYAVTGAFTSIEPSIRIDVRLIRVDSAAVVKAASVTGRKDDFFKLQEQLAARLTEGLSEVVAASDANKLVTAARANRIHNFASVLDFGKGLDASDRGDFATASKELQKVVQSEPGFALGKQRYTEIMKALYKAKDRREGLLSDSESKLLSHCDAVLAKHRPTDAIAVAYRVVRGQCYLERIHKAVESGQPAKAWGKELQAFIDNQERLITETKGLREYSRKNLGNFSSEDEKLAEELGIKQAGSTFFISTPADMMRESAMIVMTGTTSNYFADLSVSVAQRMPCPFTLAPAYGKTSIRWLESALASIEQRRPLYAERETMRTTQQLAKTLAWQGRTEEAIAKLQASLDAHPKADEFKSSERLLREMLEKPPVLWCKTR
jgi:TolB-like protein